MTEPPSALNIAQLVADFHADVYRFAYRLTGHSDDAEDLTQQTFLQAQAHLHQLREPAAAKSWLFTILRRSFQKARQQQLRMPPENGDVDVETVADPSLVESPVDPEQLQAALNTLPETYKFVLLMFYFEDCSYKEIAERLELPTGTVMSRLSRAKQSLRRLLFPAADTSPREIPPHETSADEKVHY